MDQERPLLAEAWLGGMVLVEYVGKGYGDVLYKVPIRSPCLKSIAASTVSPARYCCTSTVYYPLRVRWFRTTNRIWPTVLQSGFTT